MLKKTKNESNIENKNTIKNDFDPWYNYLKNNKESSTQNEKKNENFFPSIKI